MNRLYIINEGELITKIQSALKLIREEGWSITKATSFFGILESELAQN